MVVSRAVIEHDEGDGRTVVGELRAPGAGYAEIAALFAMHFDLIRAEHTKRGAPGLLALAFDLGSAALVAQLWTKTRADAINAFTVGRHRECDVCLPRDPAISLRHLSIVTHPYQPGAGRSIGFRILDLRTSLAFADCFGTRLQGVIAEGSTLIVVGRYALLLMPTGDGTRVPDDAGAAFGAIADPVYLDAQGRRSRATDVTQLGRGPGMGGSDAGAAQGDDGGMHRTFLSVIEGPARAGAGLLGASEEPLGTLEISAGGQGQSLVVGARAAGQGMLVGSYDRCDDDRLSHVQHPSISRVHLLILLHGETLYAIDTASTNGTFAHKDGKRVRTRLVRLGTGLEVVLGDDRARVVFRSVD